MVQQETTTAPARTAAEFNAHLNGLGMRIQMPDDPPLFTSEPQPDMTPVHWRGADIRHSLDELAQHLSLAPGSGRRTIKLTNPGLPYGTTSTFWASIQYILPGEVATAHRHTPEAFRFVLSGQGCVTTVDGESAAMAQGDLVLTPSWTWHDHVHQAHSPMLWLDVLDIPLVRALNATFFENYPRDVQTENEAADVTYRQWGSGTMRPPRPATVNRANPLLAYPKEQTDAAIQQAAGLPPDPDDDVILEYQNPQTGGPVLTNLSTKAQLLRPGFSGRAHRHTISKLYVVVEGRGVTMVGDQWIEWQAGDLFSVPSWALHRHENPGPEPARLFRVDDTPILAAAGLYREAFA